MALAKVPKVVLLRVGMDSGEGGIQGPLLPKNAFDYLPIPDDWNDDNKVTYGCTVGRHGRNLCEYWPGKTREKYRNKGIHFDPEFDTFTYGDPTRPKQSLRQLEPGDLLVFYAGLQPWSEAEGFHGDPHLYIIGYFVVAKAGHIQGLFERYGRKATEQAFANCMHIVKGAPAAKKLVVVKGKTGRLLERASLLSEYGKDKEGRRLKIMRRDLATYFGRLSKLNSLQRSPPRWILNEFSRKAYNYVLRLK